MRTRRIAWITRRIAWMTLLLSGCGAPRASDGLVTKPVTLPDRLEYAVSGTVKELGPVGSPVPGATVTFRTPSAVRSAVTDDEGAYTLTVTIEPQADCRWFGRNGESEHDLQAPCSYVVEAEGYERYEGTLRVMCLLQRGTLEIDVSTQPEAVAGRL